MFSVNAMAKLPVEQLALFKDSIKQGCISRGLERGDDGRAVQSFCACMDRVFRESLSDGDFEEIARQGMSGRPFGEIPLVQSVLPKVAVCKQ